MHCSSKHLFLFGVAAFDLYLHREPIPYPAPRFPEKYFLWKSFGFPREAHTFPQQLKMKKDPSGWLDPFLCGLYGGSAIWWKTAARYDTLKIRLQKYIVQPIRRLRYSRVTD